MLAPEEINVLDTKLTRYRQALLYLDVIVRGVRYHLNLQQTKESDASAAENVALLPVAPFVFQQRKDRVAILGSQWSTLQQQVVTNARQLFGTHYPLWEVSAGGASAPDSDNAARDEGFFNGFPCRRQLMSVGDDVTIVDPLYYCHWHMAKPLLYTIPGLPVIPKTRLTVFNEPQLSEGIFRVSLDGTVLAMKMVSQYDKEREIEFVREACTLAALPPHPNVVAFHGFVGARQGRVDAILLDFIDGKPLSDQRHATPSQRGQWKEQLRSALAHLHGQQPPVIWTSAKADNVMITSAGQAVLCNLGGRFSGLVDEHLNGTIAGDLEGMNTIYDAIDKVAPSPTTGS